MKVLIFPALLAVAIITTPPKPFTAGAGKAVTTRTTEQNAPASPLSPRSKQTDKAQNPKLMLGTEYTARR